MSKRLHFFYALTVPTDYRLPDWDNASRVNDWKNHVPEFIQQTWPILHDHERKLIAFMAKEEAEKEELE